nr:serine/threonine-protein kinase [Acanthopleuribacter pedis]
MVLSAGLATGPAWIGPYQILEMLGEGGMGQVFRAKATHPGHADVAVKILGDWLEGAAYQRRFQRECAILRRLQHDHIAALLDAGFSRDGRPYLVMPFLEGDDLKTLLGEGPIALEEALHWFDQLCDAVDAAHGRGIVHRDLKPANIIIDAARRPVLLDFGIAKLLGRLEGATLTQTQTRLRLMSLPYAAPEQITGGEVGVATDVYQLGNLLYELLTGKPPFAGTEGNPRACEWAIVHQRLPPPSRIAPDRLPTRLSREGTTVIWPPAGDWDWVLAKALAKEPCDRYPSVAAFREDVRRLASGSPLRGTGPNWAYLTPLRLLHHRHRPVSCVGLGLGYWRELTALGEDFDAHEAAYWFQLSAAFFSHQVGAGSSRKLPDLAAFLNALPMLMAEQPPRAPAQVAVAVQLAHQCVCLDLPNNADRVLDLLPDEMSASLGLWLETRLIRAHSAMQQADLNQAETYLSAVQPAKEVAAEVEDCLVGRWWMLWGGLKRRQRQWSEAETSLRRAAALLQEAARPVLAAACYNELGVLMVTVKKTDAALSYFQSALALGEQGKGRGVNQASTHQNVGQAYLGMGDLIGALGHFERAYKELRQWLPEEAPMVRLLRNNLEQLQRAGGQGSMGWAAPVANPPFVGRRHLLSVEEALHLSESDAAPRSP